MMGAKGKLIRIHLADGSPSGIRHAEVVNWTGQVMVCPRARVAELSDWPESQRPGVYVLIGEGDASTQPQVYIGEAEDVFERLKNHVLNKAFWDRVVLFTSKDANLTKAHVRYLEHRMVALAKDAKRATLENKTAPSAPSLPRADRDAMEDFLEPIRLLLSTLGFPILQPLPSTALPESSRESEQAGPLAHIPLMLEVGSTGVEGHGISTDEGFVVFRGSMGTATVYDSMPKGKRALREALVQQDDVVLDGDAIRFINDVVFDSPSAAAAILCGSPRNGRDLWKAEDGRTLKQLEQALIDTAERQHPAVPPNES